MTPQEKAEKLIEKFTFICNECDYEWNAKQCALIAVDNLIDEHTFQNPIKWNIERKKFWQEVKQEIEKI